MSAQSKFPTPAIKADTSSPSLDIVSVSNNRRECAGFCEDIASTVGAGNECRSPDGACHMRRDRTSVNLFGSSDLFNTPRTHHRYSIRCEESRFAVVGNDNCGFASVADYLFDLPTQFNHSTRVKIAERFIKQNRDRIRRDGSG